MAKKIIVISGAHAGYRRAGVKLNQGRNEFDESWFSAQQLAQLKADEKISVSEIEDKSDSSADTSGKLDANPSPTGVTLADNIAVLVEIMRHEQFDPKGKKPTVDQLAYDIAPEGSTDPMEVKPSAAERDQAWDFYTQQQAE